METHDDMEKMNKVCDYAGEAVAESCGNDAADVVADGGEDAVTEPTGATEMVSREEAERLAAEAEQRGYLKGRNEQAREMMSRPGLLSNPLTSRREERTMDKSGDFASRFLSRISDGVWD